MSSAPIVLVTGANQGLGYGIVSQLTQRRADWTYILACRNVDAGHAAATKLQAASASASSGPKVARNVSVIELDVTNDAHIAAAVAHVRATFGRLDVLVNNAGFLYPPGAADMTPRALLNATLDLNATSTVVLTTQLLPLLHRSADPKVINVTSGTSSIARILAGIVPRTLAYGGSKMALNGFGVQMQGLEWDRAHGKVPPARDLPNPVARARARGLDIELDPNAPPARIYTVAPGVTRSNFTDNTVGKDPEDAAEVVVRLVLDDTGKYPGGTFWEVDEGGEMKEVPW